MLQPSKHRVRWLGLVWSFAFILPTPLLSSSSPYSSSLFVFYRTSLPSSSSASAYQLPLLPSLFPLTTSAHPPSPHPTPLCVIPFCSFLPVLLPSREACRNNDLLKYQVAMLEDKVKKGESLREELAKMQVENEVRPCTDLTCSMSHLEWLHSDLRVFFTSTDIHIVLSTAHSLTLRISHSLHSWLSHIIS